MASYEKKNKNKKRVVVITNGPDPAYVVEYDFVSKKFTFCDIFPVLFLDEEKIVDANGAGDAFAGGFLSMYMTGKSLDKCVSAVRTF
jgi:adenosine kinase